MNKEDDAIDPKWEEREAEFLMHIHEAAKMGIELGLPDDHIHAELNRMLEEQRIGRGLR
jgi:hypothetical protein